MRLPLNEPPQPQGPHAAADAETLGVMRSIQASINDHQHAVLETQSGPSDAVELASRNVAIEADSVHAPRPPKRARVPPATELQDQQPLILASARETAVQPENATVDVRDGRTKIYMGGNEFTRSSITRIKIVYRCSFYRSQACAVKLEFYASMMDYDFAHMVPHTCTPPSRRALPLDAGTKTLVVKTAMQREVDSLAVASADSPQAIWDKVSAQFYNRDDNVVVCGMSKAQVTKRVHRTRAMHFGSDLHGRVEVAPLSLVKLKGLNFFQFHHVWTNPSLKTENKIDRLVGWAHPTLLSLLRYSKISLFIDGTFRCVPRHFRQCIVVMVYDQGTKLYVPVFYVLGASKTFDAYWNVLQYVSDTCGQRIDPKQVVCDFEMALIQAASDWFSETDIVGCFFHFKQACSRKMAKLRIPPPEIKIAMEKGVLDMLTVVEPAKIGSQGIAWARSRIKARCAEENITYSAACWAKFWTYFKKTWITLLPPKVWNVHGLRRDLVARTNNPLERFNRELNSAFGTPHPSVVRFVQTIEEISRRYGKLRDDIVRGIAAPPKRDTLPQLPIPVDLPEGTADDSDEGELDEEECSGEDSDIENEANYATQDAPSDQDDSSDQHDANDLVQAETIVDAIKSKWSGTLEAKNLLRCCHGSNS